MTFHENVNQLGSSPFFIGIMMLVLNVGSRYITHEMSNNEAEYSQNILIRRLAIFAACFVGTRDVIVSILLTAGFVILSSGFLRGKSTFAREGMETEGSADLAMRAAAGLTNNVQQPAYDKTVEAMYAK
jgi:hypothetical protein